MDYNKLYEKKPVIDRPQVALPELPDTADMRQCALAVEKDIFATYYSMMMDETISASTRKACADALADRARGKAVQSVEVSQTVRELSSKRIEVVLVNGSGLPVVEAITCE